jgi:hypothetical protein
MMLAVGQHRPQFQRAAAQRAEAHFGGILMLDFVARHHGAVILIGHARKLGGSRRHTATVDKRGKGQFLNPSPSCPGEGEGGGLSGSQFL